MPYTTIPDVADGDILTSAHLNLLSANIEFLYGIAREANAPFTSFRKTTNSLGEDDMLWTFRHRLQYLHYKISWQDASNTGQVRIFYNGTKIFSASGSGVGQLSGYLDLHDLSTLPNLQGAWASGVVYDDDDGGDGQVVTHGGQYYKAVVQHTSDSSNEPGVGGSWDTVWDLITAPAINVMYDVFVRVAKSVPAEITVEYLIESDSTSI